MAGVSTLVHADLTFSSFSQMDLQSRSPEAIVTISDPESLEVTALSADEFCLGDGRVGCSLGCGGFSGGECPAPCSPMLLSSFILTRPERSVPGAGPLVESGHLSHPVTPKAPSWTSLHSSLLHKAGVGWATHRNACNPSLRAVATPSRHKASNRGVHQFVDFKVRGVRWLLSSGLLCSLWQQCFSCS